jgi:hypothetical protein
VPPGGQANTFYDFIGNSPINLWQSEEDYGTLQTVSTRDVSTMLGPDSHLGRFPVPHSDTRINTTQHQPRERWYVDTICFLFALTRTSAAGIKYELVATVCTKGKKCVILLSLTAFTYLNRLTEVFCVKRNPSLLLLHLRSPSTSTNCTRLGRSIANQSAEILRMRV